MHENRPQLGDSAKWSASPGQPEDVAEEDMRDHQVSEFRDPGYGPDCGSQQSPPSGCPARLGLSLWSQGLGPHCPTGLASPTLVSSHTPVSGLSASRSLRVPPPCL